ncbi:NADH-quinone oxidoreductase subunit NuoG [Taylorella equigenitalis]|uniref:NADH-quinone oxidoreductase subunit NuoG n=1 Tax=Taylorella equigenitalis TaxID=29575 RepID=UPI00040D3F71|nr:NADH-quinone oxidoreductase subunit NuoG [Taylorella equigenitalis]WDU48265.1 NADH-quinone oxidoreductase subunit NuoG [Taylorella equigenitalis]
MIELTIDGKPVQVEDGTMIIQAANKLGIYIPHFCYHKKLSIAASCRMCLVEVEKAPKAVPACATPVTNGMVVYTKSPKAKAGQEAVMEFLLINHPLDCPVCDQGGECQLQDLAVGYGYSTSRYDEEKRIVLHKNLGPLVSAEEMSRCIHCTRCVRFGQEIAGQMELGMVYRNEKSEITNFLGKAIESELSGNMIDVCPVGALTSKPFRFEARTWELARRETISPHDSVGSNLIAQIKNNEVLRVLPLENESVNECWISDRDRWSYEGLLSEDRLSSPMIKTSNNVWKEVDWAEALNYVADNLKDKESLGVLASENSTLEELYLLKKIANHLGSQNIDTNLRANDQNLAKCIDGVPWLGVPIEELSRLDSALVIGSNLRKDHPLFAQRLRQAARFGACIATIDSYGEDPKIPLVARINAKPSELASKISQLTDVFNNHKEGDQFDTTDVNQLIASRVSGFENSLVLVGSAVTNAPNASELLFEAQNLANAMGAKLGFLTSGANTVGAYTVGAVARTGLSASQMIDKKLSAFIVHNLEPKFDMEYGLKAESVLKDSFAVALTPYASDAMDWARVILPIGPFTETSGTFINAEGRRQSFKGVVSGLGESRPAWKVLRVLANLLGVPDSNFNDSEEIANQALLETRQNQLSNKILEMSELSSAEDSSTEEPSISEVASDEEFKFERVAEVPIYKTDSIVRRALSLQKTEISTSPFVQLSKSDMDTLELSSGDSIKVSSKLNSATFTVELNELLAEGTIRISQGFEETIKLGNSYSMIKVERM